jgi:hypothetical protein
VNSLFVRYDPVRSALRLAGYSSIALSKRPTITPNCGLSKLPGELVVTPVWPHSSTWSDRFRLMESLLVRVIDMHAAAVSPKQVKPGTYRAALRMWIPENDG